MGGHPPPVPIFSPGPPLALGIFFLQLLHWMIRIDFPDQPLSFGPTKRPPFSPIPYPLLSPLPALLLRTFQMQLRHRCWRPSERLPRAFFVSETLQKIMPQRVLRLLRLLHDVCVPGIILVPFFLDLWVPRYGTYGNQIGCDYRHDERCVGKKKERNQSSKVRRLAVLVSSMLMVADLVQRVSPRSWGLWNEHGCLWLDCKDQWICSVRCWVNLFTIASSTVGMVCASGNKQKAQAWHFDGTKDGTTQHWILSDCNARMFHLN